MRGLGSFAGRIISFNNGSIPSLTVNHIFGAGAGNSDLPTLILNGSTLTSTRDNAIGDSTVHVSATNTTSFAAAGALPARRCRGFRVL